MNRWLLTTAAVLAVVASVTPSAHAGPDGRFFGDRDDDCEVVRVRGNRATIECDDDFRRVSNRFDDDRWDRDRDFDDLDRDDIRRIRRVSNHFDVDRWDRDRDFDDFDRDDIRRIRRISDRWD